MAEEIEMHGPDLTEQQPQEEETSFITDDQCNKAIKLFEDDNWKEKLILEKKL